MEDLYEMRNYIAHGDRIPDPYFTDILGHGFNGGVQRCEVLLEAASFIIRTRSYFKTLCNALILQ